MWQLFGALQFHCSDYFKLEETRLTSVFFLLLVPLELFILDQKESACGFYSVDILDKNFDFEEDHMAEIFAALNISGCDWCQGVDIKTRGLFND